jgi:hypothetical protein
MLCGDLDPHCFLGVVVARTFAKDNHTTVYEGTIVAYDHSSCNYGISWDDGDYLIDSVAVTISMIDCWLVKTGQLAARSRIQAGAPLMTQTSWAA